MAGASDKARYYLEQSVPELQELARKKIFSKAEISSIAKRRSDFEHKLNARGSTPIDYARYAEYEMNLESLRRKRVQRLGVKTSNHTGQRRIFFVLDRATKKFPGDLALWMQYLSFTRKQRSNKKVTQILTSLLRLHPTKADVWIYAANYAMDEHADMMEARGYMQRGLRFCKRDETLWLEYARLELFWVTKIWKRRRILGVDQDLQENKVVNTEAIDGDMVALPTFSEEDIYPSTQNEGVDPEVLDKLNASPALCGAIPMAIFDAAMTQFQQDETLCLQFFEMICEFDELACTKKILEHVTEVLRVSPNPAALICYIRQPVIGLSAFSPGFPTGLGLCLDRMKTASKRIEPLATSPNGEKPTSVLNKHIIDWMLPYLEEEELDPDVRKVILMTVRNVWIQYQDDVNLDPKGKAAEVSRLIRNFCARDIYKISESARTWASGLWPKETELFANGEKSSFQ